MSTFVNSWAAVTMGSSEGAKIPKFSTALSLFPPADSLKSEKICMKKLATENCVTKRYVIDASNIAALRSKAENTEQIRGLTRDAAVTALIWKCGIEASKSSSGSLSSTVLILPANIRKRLLPPLPENSAGNLIRLIFAVMEVKSEFHLRDLVAKMRSGLEEIETNLAKRLGLCQVQQPNSGNERTFSEDGINQKLC